MNAETLPPHIHDFLLDLAQRDVSPRTLATYRADLVQFARWFYATTGEAFTAAATTPAEVAIVPVQGRGRLHCAH